jgi:hypothetical protein
MTDTLDYGSLMHRAMRGLIFNVLEQVRDHGLPGNHHFFITFDTTHPDVQLADWLKDRYPEEMTVVIQHWFDNLVVREDGFSITLNFGDQPEPIQIPFDAIQTFVDPSVEFGLRFENQDMDEIEDEAEADESEPSADTAETSDEAPQQEAKVVSLDQFRR